MYQNSRCKITSTSFGVYMKWIDKRTSKVIVEGHLECSGTLVSIRSDNLEIFPPLSGQIMGLTSRLNSVWNPG